MNNKPDIEPVQDARGAFSFRRLFAIAVCRPLAKTNPMKASNRTPDSSIRLWRYVSYLILVLSALIVITLALTA
jgi:hypothetical protein